MRWYQLDEKEVFKTLYTSEEGLSEAQAKKNLKTYGPNKLPEAEGISRLKIILQAATRNRFVATGVGAFVTSVIQSSSATTIMVVGFVNAGLITLVQAIGVIYGANIGTTITAQVIAFKLDDLAYPAIAVGLVVSSLARRPLLKSFGQAILGFGLLFLGMSTMSSVLKPLRYSPEFKSLFLLFDCTPVDLGLQPVRMLVIAFTNP